LIDGFLVTTFTQNGRQILAVYELEALTWGDPLPPNADIAAGIARNDPLVPAHWEDLAAYSPALPVVLEVFESPARDHTFKIAIYIQPQPPHFLMMWPASQPEPDNPPPVSPTIFSFLLSKSQDARSYTWRRLQDIPAARTDSRPVSMTLSGHAIEIGVFSGTRVVDLVSNRGADNATEAHAPHEPRISRARDVLPWTVGMYGVSELSLGKYSAAVPVLRDGGKTLAIQYYD
jgi:hypothetical protein